MDRRRTGERVIGTESGFEISSVAWDDPRAVALRDAMDVEITGRYAGRPMDPEKVWKALTVDPDEILRTLIVTDGDGTPIAHAALRRLGAEFEVKRVVVLESARGRGLARRLMAEIEAAAVESGADRVILQTGDRQPEAVALYLALGYTEIPIYEPYVEAIPFSICFEKRLSAGA